VNDDDDEESIFSSTPRIKRSEDENQYLNSSHNSHGQTFQFLPENSRQLPNEKSNSLDASSSKTSVGFLNDFSFQMVELIKYRNKEKLEEELMENDDVYGPVDISKKNILHYACEFNSLEICKMIVNSLFIQKTPNIDLWDWVNTKNDDGLTSVHFAAYRGNNELIEYLISIGADVYANDNDGHNCIHIASQSDRINTIYYLMKNYNFNINKGDRKLSTPLHWAAFLNKENSLTYLLAWGADPNVLDIDKNTPLHLSVLLAWTTGMTRNVKLLLLKGAKRGIKNIQKESPLDLVQEGDNGANELKSLLKEASFISCCMLKAPLTNLRKNEKTVVFFLILVSMITILSFSYIIPTYKSDWITILSGIWGILMLLSFGAVTLKSPGYLKKDPNIDFQELLNTLDPLDICPEWEIILTPRCRHWNIWNKWVERFDHHCPYINNCVGYNNHVYFIFYITTMAINLLLQFMLSLFALIKHNNIGQSLTKEMHSSIMFYFSSILVTVLTGVFLLPVTLLVIIHLTNFTKNKTTNERFSKQKINNTSLTNKITNSVSEETRPSILDKVEYNSFMGTQHKSWISNWGSMCQYNPPSQLEMRNEIITQN